MVEYLKTITSVTCKEISLKVSHTNFDFNSYHLLITVYTSSRCYLEHDNDGLSHLIVLKSTITTLHLLQLRLTLALMLPECN